MAMRRMNELDLIDLVRKVFPQRGRGLALGIGDDCAAIRPAAGHELLMTTDTLVEGVHFSLERTTPRQLGMKTAAVNLSDIAAMGGRPRFALLSVSVTDDIGKKWMTSFLDGFKQAMSPSGCVLVGGNVSGARKGGLFFTVTAIGEIKRGLRVDRTGARPGDTVFVTGTPGEAALGLDLLLQEKKSRDRGEKRLIARHNSPTARVEWGALLASERIASAMIDVSDGVAMDLYRILKASGVRAEISLSAFPLSRETARAVALSGDEAWKRILSGGEDYELLFTVAPKNINRVERLIAVGRIEAAPIGRISGKGAPRLDIEGVSGERLDLETLGWLH